MKGKWIYLFSFLSLFASIVNFNSGYYLAGFVFLVLGLFLMPTLSELLSKKTGLPFRGMPKKITAIVLLILGLFTVGSTQRKIVDMNNMRADELLEAADSIILIGRLDQSMKKIIEAKSLYSKKFKFKAALYESEIVDLKSEQFFRAAFETMKDESFKLLEDGNYTMDYFQTPPINKAFLNKLYDNRDLRARIVEEKKERERLAKIEAEKRRKEAERKRKEEEKARKEAEKLARKLYEIELRNNFLDTGMDVKVAVRGRNYDRLELTYVLFNDVWFRKFDTEGLFDNWHKIGFNRIDIKDGYDYHKYYYWK